MKRNKRVRVRSRRLDQLDETKMGVALFLLTCDLADFDVSDDKLTLPLEDAESDALDGVDGEAE
jgi:hypothetical protein